MAGIKEEKKIYLVGIYCRLSKDDGTDNESASIATQKSILTDYVKKQGWHIAKTYVDDGYSGTNFQRPSFQNMIKDIESGLINCVITKDLSRLGRNYLDCGLYLEVFFPEHNVRYIAVNDGVDTLNKSAMDITPFRNILNEMYAADISVKIKSAYRARFQQGKFMGTTAPYGYIKDPADHNHLLIDDKVAHVVKEIFDLALKGNGVAKICRHLNKQHILRPAAYAAERGETGFERHFEGNEDNIGVSFHDKLFELIDEAHLDNKDVWKRANLDRKHFSKIQCDQNYHPKKKTVMALCIALQLDLEQSRDLLARADWAFSPSSKVDLIVQKAIIDKQYDIMQLNVTLFKYTNEILGV